MPEYRYFKFSPRGFANEVTYFRVRPEEVAAVEASFAGYEDKHPGAHTGWTDDKRAYQFGVALDWCDRAAVGL